MPHSKIHWRNCEEPGSQKTYLLRSAEHHTSLILFSVQIRYTVQKRPLPAFCVPYVMALVFGLDRLQDSGDSKILGGEQNLVFLYEPWSPSLQL
jgi:hypothetical protein